MATPFFQVPLNLPHAATIAGRLVYHLDRIQTAKKLDAKKALIQAELLAQTLAPYRLSGENPEAEEAAAVIAGAAQLARLMVDEIERAKLGDDRLGQAVRNLFECFELGQEGADISLRAGENPDSTLRPY